MNKIYKIIILVASLLICNNLLSQNRYPISIHSHNDYMRTVPFYQAYAQGVYSIEADVFLKDGILLIGHDEEKLSAEDTFEGLYVLPIVNQFLKKGMKEPLQLMVELKSPAKPTLDAVVSILKKYSYVFDNTINDAAVKVVITGNLPEKSKFTSYPDFITFDGDVNEKYTETQLKKVALFSADFKNYSAWNGKGLLLPTEEKALEQVINYAHEHHKPIRFWNAPEGVTVYYTFYNMGVDYINTDYPEVCAAFFADFGNKNFAMGKLSTKKEGVTGTRKLDLTTRDFRGFQNDKLQLSKGIDVYNPSYRNDGTHTKIKNVIFLIGDGMGLNQISAGYYANNGLSLLKMKYLGIQVNNSLDAFTTDSAAGGSTLATGESHCNRHISMTRDGKVNKSLSDYFKDKGLSVGVMTLGNVADATPAAFYGHSTERDSSDQITRYLLDARIDLLCGSGMDQFTKRADGVDILGGLSGKFHLVENIANINEKSGKVICIDERMGDGADDDNLHLLADAEVEAIKKLRQLNGDKGFFLMVEGAKIDYAGHARCFPASILEELSFDLAVAEAMKFADSNGETLVLVTADHETGGLMLLDGDLQKGRIMGMYFTDDHTPSMIPVFAYGPWADQFIGVYENTEIARKIKAITE